MGIGTILIGLALLTVITVLVVSPILEPFRLAVEPAGRREILKSEREATVRVIRELDLDYRTHKLNEDDYKALREVQVQRAVSLLRELDQLVVVDDIDAEIEEQIAAVRTAGPECPSCHAPLRDSDRFCANCGQNRSISDPLASNSGKR